HFKSVKLDEGEAGGDTIIVRLENKWFWIIPISSEKTSVGLVIDKDEFGLGGGKPDEVFWRWVESSPPIKERMASAQLLVEMQTTSDFSYYNRRLVSHRLIRVGDAAGFMDPIFSAGVFLAMWSGKHAAQTIVSSLEHADDGARRFAKYEKRVYAGIRFYWKMVE